MNAYGWIFLVASWTFITVVLVYCLYRILGSKEI
jgi:hypothetical protein